ncbi:MAG: hypothetical protein H8E55_65715 [Pelagibacterales bacterium]|nr:hypothetical protein [Pelagibacterales bacterium]
MKQSPDIKLFKKKILEFGKKHWDKDKFDLILNSINKIEGFINRVSYLRVTGQLDTAANILIQSVIYELFNLQEKIVYVSSKKNEIKFAKDRRKIESTLSLFSASLEKEIGNDFQSKVLLVVNNVINDKYDKFGYLKRIMSEPELEEESARNLLSRNLIIHGLLSIKIDLIDELFSKVFPPTFKSNKWLLNKESDVIVKIIEHLETSLDKDKQLVPFSTFLFFNYSITISKETADKYCMALIWMYVKKLESLGCNYKPKSFIDRFPRVQFEVDTEKVIIHLKKVLNIENGNLHDVIQCKPFAQPIEFIGKQNSLVYLFNNIDSLFVKETKQVQVAKWLSYYFVAINKNGDKKPLTFSNTKKILSKRNKVIKGKNMLPQFSF